MPAKRYMIVFRSWEDATGYDPAQDCVEIFKVDRFHFQGLTANGRGRTIAVFKGNWGATKFFVSGLREAGAECRVAKFNCKMDQDISQESWSLVPVTKKGNVNVPLAGNSNPPNTG